MCCVTVGDPRTAKQHYWKSEANEDHQLSPGGPSNRLKSSDNNQLNLSSMFLIWFDSKRSALPNSIEKCLKIWL